MTNNQPYNPIEESTRGRMVAAILMAVLVFVGRFVVYPLLSSSDEYVERDRITGEPCPDEPGYKGTPSCGPEQQLVQDNTSLPREGALDGNNPVPPELADDPPAPAHRCPDNALPIDNAVCMPPMPSPVDGALAADGLNSDAWLASCGKINPDGVTLTFDSSVGIVISTFELFWEAICLNPRMATTSAMLLGEAGAPGFEAWGGMSQKEVDETVGRLQQDHEQWGQLVSILLRDPRFLSLFPALGADA